MQYEHEQFGGLCLTDIAAAKILANFLGVADVQTLRREPTVTHEVATGLFREMFSIYCSTGTPRHSRPLDLQYALRSARCMMRTIGTCSTCKMVWLLVRHCAYREAWVHCVQERHCALPCTSTDLHCLLLDLARRISGLHQDEKIDSVIKVVQQYRKRALGACGGL